MLQYVSRDATLFIQYFVFTKHVSLETCEAAQSFRTVDGAELVILRDEHNVVDMSSGMCNRESFPFPKVCQCNAHSEKNKKMGGKKRLVAKNVLEFQEAALVTTRGTDRKIFLIHD